MNTAGLSEGRVLRVSDAGVWVTLPTGEYGPLQVLGGAALDGGQHVVVAEIAPPSGNYLVLGAFDRPPGSAGGSGSPQVDGPADVPSLRTLGDDSTQAAPGDHTAHAGLLLDDNARLAIAVAGTLKGTRRKLNLIAGAGITLTAADDAASETLSVTVSASGGAGGGPLGRVGGTKRETDMLAQTTNVIILRQTFTLDAARRYRVTGSAFLGVATAGAVVQMTMHINGPSATPSATASDPKIDQSRINPPGVTQDDARRVLLPHIIEPGDFASGTYSVGIVGSIYTGGGNWNLYAGADHRAILIVEDIGT